MNVWSSALKLTDFIVHSPLFTIMLPYDYLYAYPSQVFAFKSFGY